MSISTKASLFGSTAVSTFGSSSSGGSGYGGSLVGGSSGSGLFGGYGYGTGLLTSGSGLFGYGYTGGSGSSGGTTNTSPVFTSGTTASFAENGLGTVYTATATDADGDTLSYSISGGSDASRFSINSSSGALTFNASPDFDAPSDSDTDNVYVVSLQASDGKGGTDAQTVTVTVTDEVDSSASLTLTTDPDTFTPTAASTADQTTAFDDIITGVSDDTLNDDDVIDGATGTDRANIDMDDDDFGGFSGGGGMQSFEIVTLSSSVGFDREFDATGVSGVTSWVLNHSDEGVIDLVNLPDTNASISINDAKDDFTLAWASTTGDQTVTISLDDIGTSATPVQATLAGIENVTVSVAGSNFVEFVADAATSITISGSGNLDMDQTSLSLGELDASGMSGNLTADMSDVAGNRITTIASGGGDDAVTVKATSLKNGADINLGSGSSDSVTFGGAGANFQPMMSGVEDVIFAPTAGTAKFDGTAAYGISRFIVADSNAGNVTLVNTGSSHTLVLEGDDAAAKTVYSQASSSLDLHFALAEGASNAERDSVVKSLAESTVSMTIDSDAKFTGSLTANLAGSFEAAISGTATGLTASLSQALAIDITSVENDSSIDFNAASATDLTVTANAGLDLSSSTDLAAIDQLTVDTEGYFDLAGVALPVLYLATLQGSGSVEIGALGSATHDDTSVEITASGLAGTDTTGSGALEIGSIKTNGTNIKVDASNIFGEIVWNGDVNAKAGTATEAGDVELKFGDGGFTAAGLNVTGKDILFDVSGSVENVPSVTFTVEGEKFEFFGSSMVAAASAHSVILDATEVDVIFSSGGAEDDLIDIVASTAVEKIDLDGNLGHGTDIIDIDASSATEVHVDGSDITKASLIILGGTASDVLTGGGADDTLTGGAGTDEMTGGDGQNTFVFANADGDTPSDSSFDVITDFNSDGSDVIDDDTGLNIAVMDVEHGAPTAAVAGTALIDAQGLAIFDAADDSLTKRLTAVENALDEGTVADSDEDGDFVFFEFSGDTYVYISDGVDGIGAGDVLVQLEDVTGLTTSTLDGGDLMLS